MHYSFPANTYIKSSLYGYHEAENDFGRLGTPARV